MWRSLVFMFLAIAAVLVEGAYTLSFAAGVANTEEFASPDSAQPQPVQGDMQSSRQATAQEQQATAQEQQATTQEQQATTATPQGQQATPQGQQAIPQEQQKNDAEDALVQSDAPEATPKPSQRGMRQQMKDARRSQASAAVNTDNP